MGAHLPGGDAGYGIEAGLMYSFPVTCAGGKWSIVQGLAIDDRSRSLMDATAAELKEEKTMAEEPSRRCEHRTTKSLDALK